MSNSILNNLFLTQTVAHINNQNACAASNKLLVTLFKEIVSLLSPDVLLEIGARQADFSFDLSSQLPNTRFVCFEANKHSFDTFNKRFKEIANVEYLHLAISNSNGLTKIKIPKGNNADLLIKGNASLNSRTDYDAGYIDETVMSMTLDAFCSDIKPEKSVCAWVDVEGHFGAVYQGGLNTISRLDALFIELEEKSFWQDQLLASEIFSLLHKSGMVAIARDSESRFFQYNVIFVKQHLIDKIKPNLKIFLEKLGKLN